MSNRIAIAGMGWLGRPLAQHFKTLGYSVKGSVTTLKKATQLQKSGFDAYSMTISEDGVHGSVQGFLSNIDHLIIMIPPGLRRNTGSDYVLKMTHFLREIEKAKVPNCIFISSTSVYGDAQGTVTEKNLPKPENEAGRQLHQVEQLFFTAPSRSTIVRFGGLFGQSRQPARYLAGRENLHGGSAPVNLIHRDDCIGILTAIVQQDAYGHIFNAVHPNHPHKSEYYHKKAKELNLNPPTFSKPEKDDIFKKVDSINLNSILGYTFIKEI